MHVAICALGMRFFSRGSLIAVTAAALFVAVSALGSRTCLEFVSAQELINAPLVRT